MGRRTGAGTDTHGTPRRGAVGPSRERGGPGPTLNRRDLLTWLGASGGAALLGAGPARAVFEGERCPITPEQTEGPYFVEDPAQRSDLRTEPQSGIACPGVRLDLELRIVEAGPTGCAPLANARIDVWHCDARGAYSGVRDPWFGEAGEGFLRGYQRSDVSGIVRFTTIYPGWYPGRAVHIHVKARSGDASGRRLELTSQLYFDDAVTRRVHARPPYAERGAPPPNRSDGIYRVGGPELTLDTVERGDGYAASFDLALRRG